MRGARAHGDSALAAGEKSFSGWERGLWCLSAQRRPLKEESREKLRREMSVGLGIVAMKTGVCKENRGVQGKKDGRGCGTMGMQMGMLRMSGMRAESI